MKSRTPLIIAVVILLGSAYLLFDFHLPDTTRFWRELQNLGHVPLFGLISIGLLFILANLRIGIMRNTALLYFSAFMISIFLGAATEMIQYFTPRDADINDWIFDIIGAALFLGFYFTVDPGNSNLWRLTGRLFRRSLQVVLLAAAFMVALPQITLGVAYIEREKAFPEIVSFDSRWEQKFIDMHDAKLDIVEAPAGWHHDAGERVGRITFMPAEYPGISIYETAPDWSGYSRLSFEVYSEIQDSFLLCVRIDDIHHDGRYEDRYTGRLRIHAGDNTVAIPIEDIRHTPGGRLMDLKHITHLLIFMVDPPENRVLYFNGIKLE